MSAEGTHTKSSIEAIDAPQIAVQFTGQGDEEEVRVALERINDTLVKIVEGTGIKIGCLRLIHVTSFMDETVRYWQIQLGLPVNGVTALADGEGEVAGKHFMWGGGRQEATYAIVILSDAVLDGISRGLDPAISTFAHELGHVDDAAWRLLQLGQPLLRHPMLYEWDDMRAFFSDMMWSECAANLVARQWRSEREIEQGRGHWVTMLSTRRARISEAIDEYRSTGDITALWTTGHANLAVLITQLGRAIGEALKDEGAEKLLIEATRAESPGWGGLTERAVEVLAELASCAWTEGRAADWSLRPLEPLITRAFHLEHLHPVVEGGQLRIDVPPRNDQERGRAVLAQAIQRLRLTKPPTGG